MRHHTSFLHSASFLQYLYPSSDCWEWQFSRHSTKNSTLSYHFERQLSKHRRRAIERLNPFHWWQLLKWISSLSIPDNQPLRNWTYLAWCTSNQFFCMNLKHYCCQKRFPTNTQPRGYEYPNNTRIFQDTMYLIKIKGLSAITHPVD